MKRRDFLKAAAIAPVAAPAIAKASMQQGYATGGFISLPTVELSIIEAMTPSPHETYALMAPANWLDATFEPNPALRRLLRSAAPWDVPNRLYGAFIKPDGDAA